MDMGTTGRRRLPALVALVCAAVGGGVTSPGCAEFDTTPPAVEQGTLGEEIVQVFCERIAREANPDDVSGARWKPVCEGREAPPADAPPRLVALMANRERLAEALDRTLPAEMSDDLGLFLNELLPFFDRPDERLPTQTRRLADFLNRLSADDEAVGALERFGTRRGYRPLRLALGVTRPTLAYPEFDSFAELALATLLDGAAAEEFTALQRALALEMATMEAEPEAPDERTTLAVTRELMFRQDELFATSPAPQWVLLRDERGLALPARPDGALASPFVDMDADGLADVDSLGRFVDAGGTVLDVPAPFRIQDESGVPRDPSGRAIRSDGSRYYRYIDANRTMLAGVTAEMAPWFDPDDPTLMQMSRGLPVLLGPGMETSETYGSHTLRYRTFDTQNGPMFDAVAALGEMLHRPETEDALLVAEALLRDHESQTAGVLRSARFLANESDRHPEARLTQPNILWDDLIALVVSMAQQPGMLEAVLRSFSDERSARLGATYASFMRNKDRVTYDPDSINGEPLGLPLDEPVDRSMPDTFDNESMFQRTLALIDGLNGVRVCNRDGAVLNIRVLGIPIRYPLFGTADACELIDIQNVAEAYALSILGEYELELQSGFLSAIVGLADALGIDVDAALEEASGIDGLTRHPTPQALNRLVFWGLSDPSGVRSCTPDGDGGDCNSTFAGQIFDPVNDRHGNPVIERYHGTIFAWEAPGFYDGMAPLLEVLHRPEYIDDEDGDYVFGELLSTLHQHWASPESTQTCGPDECSPGEPNFSYQSNARSYEELVAAGFAEGALTERLQPMNVALESIEVRPGTDGVAALAAAAEVMVDPRLNEGLTDRHGRSSTTVNDGSREVSMTPLYMLLDALRAMDDAWAAEPDRRAEFLVARHAMAEQFLGTETLGEGFRMRNQRAHAILLTALPFVRDRIAEHRADGDLLEWATGLDEDMADAMREPLMSALIHFLDAVNEDPESRTALAELLGYLVSEASDNDAFASTLYGLADALMILEDDRNIVPLMNALSEGMAPNVRDVVAGTERELDLEGSAVRDALDLVRDIQEVDDERTLRVILQNAVALPDSGDPVTPLETIIDVIAEVNRATPDEGGSLRADDYRSVFGEVTDFMLDEEHGLERLNLVVQNRQCFPEQGLACPAADMQMESSGLCYEGATCTCSEVGETLQWRCARP
ncbi:MAG TPA: hypothetical protein RMH99_31105 [Sandaracinaceae bacterium LLY-WYZ-13_1]|nr:hypothetical protein [Sandaracinaceae bacterium LLY-WYZ-13_1]